jgi:hypothetical protein
MKLGTLLLMIQMSYIPPFVSLFNLDSYAPAICKKYSFHIFCWVGLPPRSVVYMQAYWWFSVSVQSHRSPEFAVEETARVSVINCMLQMVVLYRPSDP